MPEQRSEAWLKSATPEQIVAAQKAGELATYLGGKTVEEQAHAAVVAGAPDRAVAAAYGLRPDQLRSNGDRSSNWFETMRQGMDAAQLDKLNWVEQATPAEVYAAQVAGDLDHLTGKDVMDSATRLDAVRAATIAAMTPKEN